MTDVLDKWSLLDPSFAAAEVNAAVGQVILDQWCILDPAKSQTNLNAALNAGLDRWSLLDPTLSQTEVNAALASHSSYKAKSVTIAGGHSTYLSQIAGSIADDAEFTAVCWVKIPSASFGLLPDVLLSWPTVGGFWNDHLDIGANFTSDLSSGLNNSDGSQYFYLQSLDGAVPADAWTMLWTSYDTNHPSGSRIGFLQVNGINVSNPGSIVDVGPDPFASSWQNIRIPASSISSHGTARPFDIADMQIWIGQCIDPTVPSNLAKFVSGGKPVNPATAATAFGMQTMLFSGDHTSFATNKGSGGAFTLTGSLTDATTSPSD